MTIQPENPTYQIDEKVMSERIVSIIISDGGLAPGLECNVTVHTEDGSAMGKS